jgi:hypothetical protein
MRYANTIENWKTDHDGPPFLEDPDPEKEETVIGTGTQKPEEPLPQVEATAIDTKDSKRRSGDASDWWYYLKNIGLIPLIVVVLLAITAVICSNFTRTTSKNAIIRN